MLFSLFIDVDGLVQCWGYDGYGQVSDTPSGTFVQVSAGHYHSCGVDISGVSKQETSWVSSEGSPNPSWSASKV